ncbi:MAG: dienelactone hydrolase family protein [Vulcanimicrobiota bacterium]
MTEQLTASDDHTFSAYHVRPAEPRAGLLVVQEIFGVNAHIREVADGYAADGYEVLAPALFDRVERGVELDYSSASLDRGRELAGALGVTHANPAEGLAGTLADLQACITWLRNQGLKVGLVGYCFGGALAWLAANRLDLDASVGYYGGMIDKMLDQPPNCPVMLHFGEQDPHISLASVAAVEKAYPDLPIYRYPAGHGFNRQPELPVTQLARQRTLDFFARHLA